MIKDQSLLLILQSLFPHRFHRNKQNLKKTKFFYRVLDPIDTKNASWNPTFLHTPLPSLRDSVTHGTGNSHGSPTWQLSH